MSSPVKIFKQAILNPEKFFLLGGVTNPLYNSTPFDETWFKDGFKDWQNRSTYSQKRNFNNISVIQLHTTSTNITLSLVDCNLKEYRTYQDFSSSYPGMTATYNGVEYPLNTNTFFTQFDLQDDNVTPIPEGTYYFLVKATYETQTSFFVDDYYISEPIYLAEKHNNCVYIEYKHSRNQLDTIFQQFGNSTYSILIEGIVDELLTKASDTQYNDQHFNFRMLNSYPYEQWKLFIGEVIGIPEWIWEKVHLSLSCDNVKIENTSYTKDESAEWNVIRDSRRVWADIQIRPSVNFEKLTAINVEPFVIFSVPPYPFFDHSMKIGNVFHYVSLPAYNDTDLQAIVDYHNVVIRLADGLIGLFSIDETLPSQKRLIYTKDITETITQASSTILTKVITMNNPTVSSNTMTLQYTYKDIGIVWGDGGFEGAGDTINSISTPIVHNFAGTGGNKFIDIFHEDGSSLTSMVLSHGIADITGSSPGGLTLFELQNSVMTTFDANFFSRSLTFLVTANILNNHTLASISNLYHAWQSLITIQFTGNALTIPAVNQALIDFDNSANDFGDWGDPDFGIDGQTPSAPPSGAGITAQNHLVTTYNWTISTD